MSVDARKERFELVEVFDRPMLFTCLRVDRNTVPKGLYLYEVGVASATINEEGKLVITYSDGTIATLGKVIGPRGEQGIQGEKGDTGAQGEKGEQGSQGEQGVQGIQGEKGEQGIQGEKGDTGEMPVVTVA